MKIFYFLRICILESKIPPSSLSHLLKGTVRKTSIIKCRNHLAAWILWIRWFIWNSFSCIQVCIQHRSNLNHSATDIKAASLLALLDLLVAFNLMDHSILLDLLWRLVTRSTLWQQFFFCLRGQVQFFGGERQIKPLAFHCRTPQDYTSPPSCLIFTWSYRETQSIGLWFHIINILMALKLIPVYGQTKTESQGTEILLVPKHLGSMNIVRDRVCSPKEQAYNLWAFLDHSLLL